MLRNVLDMPRPMPSNLGADEAIEILKTQSSAMNYIQALQIVEAKLIDQADEIDRLNDSCEAWGVG